jgi:hypothetical protein
MLLTRGALWAAEPIGAAAPADGTSLRTERVRLDSGADLITFFEPLPGFEPVPGQSAFADTRAELPLLTVLKDTLNDSDPDNDRLRQVWVFTYAQPSIWQRIAGGIPFLYRRSGLRRNSGTRPPRPVLDLGDPSRGLWTGLALAGLRSELLNPVGALARLTTNSFFDNYAEYRETHLWEAGDVLSALQRADPGGVTPDEVHSLEERLELAGHPLGGLVVDADLPRDHERLQAKQTETRGHNWELLRQRAEDSGLYLEALESGGLAASFALLWVAEPDLETAFSGSFDSRFLNISNPFCDERLQHWEGYSETWDVGAPDAEGSQPVRMIPLAVYALDHPHTPLLLVDFRGPGQPKRREIGLKIAEDLTSGVLSLTGFGRLGYVALKSSYMFVHGRHGGATNRPARRRAFVSVRNAIGSDLKLDPQLRTELLSRIERVDVNPVERSWEQEIRDGWRQYDALMAYARTTQLAREVDRDRGDETNAGGHSPLARVFLHVAAVVTAGLYNHHDTMNPGLMAQLDQQRRTARLKQPSDPLPPGPTPGNDTLLAGKTSNNLNQNSAPAPATLGDGQ